MSRTVCSGLAPGALKFSVLGPLTAEYDGRPLALGPLKQRLVLATLLLRPGSAVSVDALAEAVWNDDPPRTARKNLQVYVSGLRRALAPAGDRLVQAPGGYLLRVAEAELDVSRSRALAQAGRRAAEDGDCRRAAELLCQARRLWQGPALPELTCSEVIRQVSERLAFRHLTLCEDWAEVALKAGQINEVVEVTAELVERHPLRERLRAVQMIALHLAGRRSEALATYDDLRQRLAHELGLSPNAALESRYRSILTEQAVGPATTIGVAAGGPPRSPVVLPVDIPDFTGRAAETARLLENAVDGATGVVVGPAGVGKTALAVHAAHQLADAYPDGRVLVRLRDENGEPRPPAVVTAELLAYARLTDGGSARLGDSDLEAALWRGWLADRRVLLILDDAATENSVRPLLPGAGRSTAIVTARTQLGGITSARRITLESFSAAEALDLLAQVIGHGRVNRDRASARRIVLACGQLPLAVRAAAQKLAVLRHLPLDEYAERLEHPGAVLDELTVGDLDVRARAADAWRDLADHHLALLVALSSLPLNRTFRMEQVIRMLGRGPGEARRVLETMIEAGAVLSPRAEARSHSADYLLPYLLHLYAGEVGLTGEVGLAG
ncbi:BTAD domain-containing putative transcriptional regulator [Streptomyces sp. NBRC 109706]|uniref:AfsR/SARP family transcriptional regulator n=1 Tax=Streptomyces sp. NBRC 109706 TaxID=1550035 RepID=UPI00082F1311|nr:BTAD domain-containing putative transcriptional regulator [Streptomyces sp. NBRC 109706]